MELFGRKLTPGPVIFDDGKVRVDAVVDRVNAGYKITGTIRGRAGTIEMFRAPAPKTFLMNNWQSWGPMQTMAAGQRLDGVAERMANYSRFVFTPIPEVFAENLVSDYFVAWRGGLAGFLSSRIAHPYFVFDSGGMAGCLEYFGAEFDEPVALEPMIVLEGEPELLLEQYAVRTAVENRVTGRAENPVGWSSWYHYFTDLRLCDIEINLRIAREKFPFEVFQVDDGFEADIGDWLATKPGFGSLGDLAGMIGSHGFQAGLWTAPFSAAESSELYGRHPEWMVADARGAKFCYRNWHKSIFALDTTHPDVKNWLHETFVQLKRTGFDYFKVDFLFSAAMEGRRCRNVTPIQAYREGMEVIRGAIGNSFLLGCGAPLLPSLGYVDGMRIGEDTAPFWSSTLTGIQGPNARIALKNAFLRSFMNKKWWLNDPDCLLLRKEDIELTPSERELYARAAGALDNMIIESDNLELVDEWGRNLLSEALRLQGGHVRVQGLLQDDLYTIWSWGGRSGEFRYVANLGEQAQKVEGRDIAPHSGVFL